MDEKRNIASLLRSGSHYPVGDVNRAGELGARITDTMVDLYDGPRTFFSTQKGRWDIQTRMDFSIPFFLDEENKEQGDGFAAIYLQKTKDGHHDPITLFRGRLGDIEDLRLDTEELTKKVLEQRTWFAWPPRDLTAENGSLYGAQCGALALPLSIMALDLAVQQYGYATGNFTYHTLATKLVKGEWGSDTALRLIGASYMMVGGITLALRMGQDLGVKADQKRVKNLSPRAVNYQFGKEAIAGMDKEAFVLKDEIRKAALYQEIQKAEVQISKSCFSQVYELMRNVSLQSLGRVTHYLKQNAPTQQIPLEKIVNVFSVA